MSGAHTINRKAFCLLSRISDLWMCTQTARASELLVLLNSEGAHADSTRARLLAVSDSVDISSALASLSSRNLNKREFFRMIPTLQYLSDLGIHISEAPPSNPSPLILVDLLRINLQNLADSK